VNPYVVESRAFHVWLRRNNNHLRPYAPDEIAQLAIACGFNLLTICPGVTDHLQHLKRLMQFWESPLAEKWMRVCQYENGRD
jgi:hypothetical protein